MTAENQTPASQDAKVIYKQDGDMICATLEDFVNLQESPAGFGKTEDEAKANLFQQIHAGEDTKPFGVKIMICVMHDDMPHEIATASLRSKVPFTKQGIEKFIETDDFIKTVKDGITEDDAGKEIKVIYIICNNQ